MWKIVTSSNLNPLLKLFFYSSILTNNNMLLKIYCENIIVTFLKYDILFFILFLFSLFSFHPYVFFLFFFPTLSPPHTLYLYPHPLLFLFLPHSSLQHSYQKILQHFLFFSPIRSLWFFFFFFHTLSLYLYPPSFICFVSLMRNSHSPVLSLCFFFFYLIPKGIMDKVFFIIFPLKLFLPI